MIYPPATRILMCDVQNNTNSKWENFVDGGNGYLYGIPSRARRVLQLHVEDNSIQEIGPDLGDEWNKFHRGIKAENGSIYCISSDAMCFLKITPRESQVAEVIVIKYDHTPWEYCWTEGALAKDGCIYYDGGGHILKFDPKNSGFLSLVGEYIYYDYDSAFLRKDECLYGITDERIIIFSPDDDGLIYKDIHHNHEIDGAVLANDGNIYTANEHGQILKVNTANNKLRVIGSRIYNKDYGRGWGRPVLGDDKCIYFPPSCHAQVFKFNPITEDISLIGDFYRDKSYKWNGAVLAPNGYIYCVPYHADHVLQIDSRDTNEKILELMKNIYYIGENVKKENMIKNLHRDNEGIDELVCCTIG